MWQQIKEQKEKEELQWLEDKQQLELPKGLDDDEAAFLCEQMDLKQLLYDERKKELEEFQKQVALHVHTPEPSLIEDYLRVKSQTADPVKKKKDKPFALIVPGSKRKHNADDNPRDTKKSRVAKQSEDALKKVEPPENELSSTNSVIEDGQEPPETSKLGQKSSEKERLHPDSVKTSPNKDGDVEVHSGFSLVNY